MIKNELRIFFAALMFYTRIPVPQFFEYREEDLNATSKYFPLIGWIVGSFAVLSFYLFQYLFDTNLAIVFSMLSTVLVTGAFHEDGFADSCDGFGGGWTREKILLIMKDSRLGTYGVIGLFFILSIKFALLQSIAVKFSENILVFFLLIITAHTLSRFVASTFIYTSNYVRLSEESKVKPVADQIKINELVTGGIFTSIPIILLIVTTNQIVWLAILLPLLVLRQYLSYYFNKWIGGYTGDCLGTVQQLSEIFLYLSFILIWRFI
jgi:adenosylcobinamide-GDP ribazoletransferase